MHLMLCWTLSTDSPATSDAATRPRKGLAASGLLLALLVLVGLLAPSLAQTDGSAEEEEDGPRYPWLESEEEEEEERLPLTNLRVVVSEEIMERTEFYGRVMRIELEREEDIRLPGGGIRRIVFEGDPEFEARTYEYERLYELLGAPPETSGSVPSTAVLHVRDRDVPTGIARIPYDRIETIEYPRTWLDIFLDAMNASETLEQRLETLDAFRWRYEGEIAEGFSPRMREAFDEAVINQLLSMRDEAPENPQVVLTLGDYLAELGRFDEELELYAMARNRELADPQGEMAYRLGRLYLRVLQVPETAVEELEAVPFPPESRVGIEAALLRMEALLESERYYELRSLTRGLFAAMAAYEESWRELDEAEREALLEEREAEEEPEEELLRWHARGHLLVGQSYLREGRLYDAARRLRYVPEDSPDSTESQLLLATCYLSMDRFDGTRSPGSSVLPGVNFRRIPELAGAMREATRISDGQAERVLRTPEYDPVAAGQPEVAFDPLLARALCLMARAELNVAMQDALVRQQREQQRRARAEGRMQPLLTREINPQAPSDALKYAVQAWRHDPSSAEPLLIFAEVAMRPDPNRGPDFANELRRAAFAWLERAGRLDPTNSMRHYKKGFYHARQRNFAEAIPALREAIRMEPRFVDAYVLLGELYYRLALNAARTGEGGDPQGLMRRAIDTFSSGLAIDPSRVRVQLKLGHCYLERAKSNFDRAQREVGLYRLGQIDREAVQRTWHSVAADLELAREHLEIESHLEPTILEVIPRLGATPWVVIDAGEQAGVEQGLVLRAHPTGEASLTLRVFEVGETIAVTEPENFETDPAVARAMGSLRRGDRLSRPQMPGRRVDDDPQPRVLFPEETLIARSALGYVHYMSDYIRDFIDERGGALDGAEYVPGPELERAEETFRWVIEWVAEGHGGGDFEMHPAHLYAREAYARLLERRRRVQWVDTFNRDRRGDRIQILGEGWQINRDRDPGLTYRTSSRQSNLRIFVDDGDRARGAWTTILREEPHHERFHAIQADLVVEPQSGIPQDVHGEFGLAIQQIDPRADDEEALQMQLFVTVDRLGTWRVHYRDAEEAFTREIEIEEVGPYAPSPIRPIRLVRESQERGRDIRYRLELGESHAAVLPVPEERGGRRTPELRVGLAVLPQEGETHFDARVSAVRIIRDRDEED